MLKKINQILKLVGFNLVHAKKPKAYAIKGTITGRAKAYVAGSRTCKSGDASATTCIGATPSEGRTHYVGDTCYPAHADGPTGPVGGLGCAGIPGPNQDNKITGQSS